MNWEQDGRASSGQVSHEEFDWSEQVDLIPVHKQQRVCSSDGCGTHWSAEPEERSNESERERNTKPKAEKGEKCQERYSSARMSSPQEDVDNEDTHKHKSEEEEL